MVDHLEGLFCFCYMSFIQGAFGYDAKFLLCFSNFWGAIFYSVKKHFNLNFDCKPICVINTGYFSF